jgi:hypothetical protein
MSKVSHSFTPRTKIDACCDLASSRYALGSVEVIPSTEKGEVYCSATDGRVATVAIADGEADGVSLMPAKLAKPGKLVSLNGRWECAGKVANTTEGRFPRLEDVLPTPTAPYPEMTEYTTLVLKGPQLKLIADAIAGESGTLTLFVPRNGAKGYVDGAIAIVGENGLGVVMATVPSNTWEDYETRRKAYTAARKAVFATQK